MTPKNLNWPKGFFRLWLVASIIWIAGLGIFKVYPAAMYYNGTKYLYYNWLKEEKHYRMPNNEQDKRSKECNDNRYSTILRNYFNVPNDLIYYSALTILPPVVALLLGSSVILTMLCFNSKRNKNVKNQ